MLHRALSLSALLLVACGGEPAQTPAPTAAPAANPALPPGHPSTTATPAAAAQAGEAMHVGKALEVLEGGGYTYVKLQVGAGEEWIAGPLTKVAAGDMVQAPRGAPMVNFASPTLGRTFTSIDFVRTIQVGTSASAPAAVADPHAGAPAADPHAGGPIEALAGGLTVGQIWAEQEKLGGKEVAVRARVVKYTPGILNTNFMHIQDGTGDPGSKTNDITVTTLDGANVGDVVVVRGKLTLKKDYGVGYTYPILIEDAKLSAQ